MTRIVADATAIAGWFGQPSAMRREYESGALVVIGPRHLPHDLLGELVARRGADADTAVRLAREVDRLGFQIHDPPLDELARWLSRGLPAHRAAYAALASHLGLTLVTNDKELRRAAAPLTNRSMDA